MIVLRSANNAMPLSEAGNQIHSISDCMTARPLALNTRLKLSGETSIICDGKKRRSSDQGHHSAIPKPPLVSMSSSPCEIVLTPTNINAAERALRKYGAKAAAKSARASAKPSEWVKPRWPST